MFWVNLFFAFTLALIISLLLTVGLRWRHPSRGRHTTAAVFTFVLLFLSMLLISVWFPPGGPLIWGAPWLGMLLAGLFVALIFAAAAPPPRESASHAVDKLEETAAMAPVFGVFFWILVFTLIAGLVVRYL